MTLTPNATQPGLWINPDWTPGTPGTFALLIGVSTYDHLTGGAGKKTENSYGLGQLAVSAWTAYALFNWLRTSYQYGPAPLAHCWLLMAPTADEATKIAQAVTSGNGPDVLAHNLLPSFANQEIAISFWNDAMSRLPKGAAAASRSLFFFSGHGLEIHLREQILLPADYLGLPNTHNRALNVRKLADAMTKLAVCDQFFFVDACRNTHPDLAVLNVQGTGFLTISSTELVNSACNSAILYATATGMPAHQHNSPGNGYSLFGQALLDGLQSKEGFVPECMPAPCSVQLAPLQRFIGQRYNQLLTASGWNTKQYIKLGSEPLDLYSVVTQVTSPTVPAPTLPSVRELELINFTKRLDISLERGNTYSGPSYRINREQYTHYADTTNPLTNEPMPMAPPSYHEVGNEADSGYPISLPESGASLHRILGRESVTAFWSESRLYSLDTKRWLKNKELPLSLVEQTTYSAVSTGYRLTFQLNLPGNRYWLQLSDGETTYGIPLPPMTMFQAGNVPSYRLDFTVTADGHVPDLQANLAHGSGGSLSRIADLWEKYQTVDVSSAADMVDMDFLHGALQQKMASPFAALVGATVLLQARRYDLAEGDWLRNLANWFPELPDGLVVRNQWLAQTSASDSRDEQIANVLLLHGRGIPYTGEAFSLAVLQLDRLLESDVPDARQQRALKRVHGQLREALRYFRPGGLLAVYAGKPGSFTPATLGYV
ncbi:caspase family protein [Fibrella forsythiae]|uniref:Caspase family protein n=1 Tax=Fibrella forsythiae TaxID=2817061 RepID=A0ABS3JL20_9BACT|nr:caspase family protein [Fibrella forsythiae]MBO0950128.1 caspase family protein [Fibrella forsythiae]